MVIVWYHYLNYIFQFYFVFTAISIQLLDSSDYMSSGYSSADSDGGGVGIYLPPEVFSQHSVSDSAEQVSMVTVAYKDVSGFIGEPIM